MTSQEWIKLTDYLAENPIKGFSVSQVPNVIPYWVIEEQVGIYQFKMRRFISGKRLTDHDDLGLIGLNSLDLKDRHCFLTEGVTDFITKKLHFPNSNVLGVLNLSGSATARQILRYLFDSYTIIMDNDTTGVKNASNFRRILTSMYKTVKFELPPYQSKDYSEYFLNHVI